MVVEVGVECGNSKCADNPPHHRSSASGSPCVSTRTNSRCDQDRRHTVEFHGLLAKAANRDDGLRHLGTSAAKWGKSKECRWSYR